jgi:hypothetical protein
MKILDRLPLYEEPTLIDLRGEVLQVWANQIIVWVSIEEKVRPFPAILDTGHSHNFSIARGHLQRWTGLSLRQIGKTKVGTEILPQYSARLYIHRNRTGERRLAGGTYALEMHQGISVVPDDSRFAPRIPLIGLRTITCNNLNILINGRRGEVTLRTPEWWFKGGNRRSR